MLGLIARHSFLAICGTVLVEELGIPMPIPSDLLIISAGATALPWMRFVLWFILLSLSSATGASGLYALVRRGGRPLVERAGRYVHLGPETLARGEALLARSGWGGIALGRATPGLRLPTVVVCGLLGVPYRRFITAHIAGSAVYILVFLAIGRLFGPAVLERLHLPRLSLRLIGLIVLAGGLPTLLAWWCARVRATRPSGPAPHRHLALGTAALAGLVGTIVFAATWSAGGAVADLTGRSAPFVFGYRVVGRLIGRGDRPHDTFLLGYALLLLAGTVLGAFYLALIAPRFGWPSRPLAGQIAGLALIACALGAAGLLIGRPGRVGEQFTIAAVPALGSVAYATTVVCACALGLTFLPKGTDRTPPPTATPATTAAGTR